MKKSFSALARHLLDVAMEGIKHGDKSRALVNFGRFTALARDSRDPTEKNRFERIARLFGKVLAEAPTTEAGQIAQLPAGYTPPTPETAVKLRKRLDPIDYMKTLTAAQEAAAKEIRAIYEGVGQGLQAKGLNLVMDRVDVSVVVREPWAGMPEYLQARLYTHFKPWQDRQRKVKVAPNRATTARDVVFLVLFDMMPLHLIDKVLGVESGTAADTVKAALDDYWCG